jgi:hypothetical protein
MLKSWRALLHCLLQDEMDFVTLGLFVNFKGPFAES